MKKTLLILIFMMTTPSTVAYASDAFCICINKMGEHHFYNLRGQIPKDCSKYLFHSSTDASINSKSKSARNKLCKTGKAFKTAKKKKKKGKNAKKVARVSSTKQASISNVAAGRIENSGAPPATPFNGYIASAAKEFDLPEALIHAVVRVESNYKPDAVSSAGAQGLMQLMPGTASDMKVADPFDPEQNIRGGARYLRRLADHYDGDIIKTLSAYHAGFRAVDRKDGIPYEQTEKYVKKVLSYYYKMRPSP